MYENLHKNIGWVRLKRMQPHFTNNVDVILKVTYQLISARFVTCLKKINLIMKTEEILIAKNWLNIL
jgi:hypothetical protein